MPHTPPGATHQRFIVCSFICCMQLVLATVHALFCVVYANATKYCGGIYTHTNIALHCLGLAALLWPRLLWPFWWVVCENFIFLYCFCISFFFIAWLGSNDLFALLYFCFFFFLLLIFIYLLVRSFLSALQRNCESVIWLKKCLWSLFRQSRTFLPSSVLSFSDSTFVWRVYEAWLNACLKRGFADFCLCGHRRV